MSERASRIGRNFAVFSAAQFVSKLGAALVTIHLARAIGAHDFGVITFAIAVLGYWQLFVNWGFQRLGPREIVRNPERVPELVGTIVTIRIGLALVGLLLLGVFSKIIPQSPREQFVMLLYGASLFIYAMNLDWVFVGLELLRYVALAEMVIQTIATALILILVRTSANTAIVPIIYLVSSGAGAILLLHYYRQRYGSPHLRASVGRWRQLMVTAFPRALSDAMAMLNFNFDALAIRLLLGTLETGLYGAAYRVIFMPSMLAMAYFTSLMPSLDKAYANGLESVSTLLNKSIRITGAIGIGLGVGGTLLAAPGFHLIFGEDYNGSIRSFQILIWSISLLFISRNYRTLLVAFEQQRAELKVMSFSAIVNVVLNLILVPTVGLEGAATATLISEVSILVFCYYFTRRLIGHVPLGRHLWRILLAGGVMGGVLVWSEPYHLFIRMALGSVTYGVALLAFRAIAIDEILQILQAMRPTRAPKAAIESPAVNP